MRYRRLGKTGLMVSEIGLGGEWLERHNTEEVRAVIDCCEEQGINILDCWMPEPNVRSNIGKAIAGKRKKWIIQGHFGSTWQNGQYVRTRDMDKVGMLHNVDAVEDYQNLMDGEFLAYAKEQKRQGTVRHIGISTHNPTIAKMAIASGEVEMILFSINPAFDLLPPSEDILDVQFKDDYTGDLKGMHPERAELYRLCEQQDIGITVMKGYAGGRLFSPATSPLGVALTPVQCLHYALTRPAVASVLVGYDTPEHVMAAVAYEEATDEEKNYADILANAPRHAYFGQCTYCGHCAPCPQGIDIAMVNKLYDLATMQDTVPPSVTAHYNSLSARAEDCISCGSCETRCPFGVHVVERMEMVRELNIDQA